MLGVRKMDTAVYYCFVTTSVVSTQFQRVTDRQTDRRTARHSFTMLIKLRTRWIDFPQRKNNRKATDNE